MDVGQGSAFSTWSITGRMWAGILYVGAIMAAGTLFVLDASLPVAAGAVEASATLATVSELLLTVPEDLAPPG